MRPNRETPLTIAHEVGMIIAYTQVIDRSDFVQVGDGLDGDPLAVVRRNLISSLDLLGTNPTFLAHVKRMLSGRADVTAAHAQIHDRRRAHERPFDNLDFSRPFGI